MVMRDPWVMTRRGLLGSGLAFLTGNGIFTVSSLLFLAFGENDIKIELSSPDWSMWKIYIYNSKTEPPPKTIY